MVTNSKILTYVTEGQARASDLDKIKNLLDRDNIPNFILQIKNMFYLIRVWKSPLEIARELTLESGEEVSRIVANNTEIHNTIGVMDNEATRIPKHNHQPV